MARRPTAKTPGLKRREIYSYFEGVNTLVANNIFKKGELSFVENARSNKIGAIEKREGTRRLGDAIGATNNSSLFYFENSTATNKGIYRISTVSGTTSVYYLNSSAAWTALSGAGTSLTAGTFDYAIGEDCCFLVNNTDSNRYIASDGVTVYGDGILGASDSQFDITVPGDTRYTWDGTGTDPQIETYVNVGDVIHITASNFASGNKGAFEVKAVGTNYFEVTNASGVAETNKTIGTGTIRVNSHLTNSPVAGKINYYKNRLYLADYTSDVRHKTGIVVSSPPLGIVSLVDGDHASGVTEISVTDTKYIYSDDVLDVYRGGEKITTLIVTGKSQDTITVDTTAVAINSSDELWVGGTYNHAKIFRWTENISSGVDVEEYDTFKMPCSQTDRIKMLTNISNIQIMANDSNLAIWDDSNLTAIDMGIGCVSDYGYVKVLGTLWFIHYTGIYATTGGGPKLMSSKVEKIIEGASKSDLQNACAGARGLNVFFYIGDSTLYNPDGSVFKTLSDVVLEYNMRTENWYVHTGIKATQFATYISSSDANRLEFASTETGYDIYEFLNGRLDIAVTNDEEIPFRIDSPELSLASTFEEIFYPHEIIIEAERGSSIKTFISLDGGDFYELKGEAIKGCTRVKITNKDNERESPPRCRKMKISIRDFSKALCSISKIAIIYSETGEEEDETRYK